MKNFYTKNLTSAKKNVFHYSCTDFLCDTEYGLYVEDYFHEMIYLERKRTERSKRSFVLMLLDIREIHYRKGIQDVLKGISASLTSMIRETDLKGWYKHNLIIGVLFTELNSSQIEPLRKKAAEALLKTGVMTDEDIRNTRISFHVFPDRPLSGDNDGHMDLTLYPDLLKKNSARKASLFLKRIIDIIGAVFALIIFSPLLIIIPLIIKLTSKGPVLFTQARIGREGKAFTFLKFRSMYAGNDEKIHAEYVKKLILEGKAYSGKEAEPGESVYKIKDDPRITPFGKLLRKTSMDELPQFINVLKGEMSLVGPRPPIPYEIESYDVWHWRRILDCRPGITGLWQVKGRSRTNFNDMVRLDIRYIKEWSIWLDLKLLIKTPWSLLSSKGAY